MSTVTFRLPRDEALVLFDWLSRLTDEAADLRVEHEAEETVVWRLLGFLEKTLSEPFDPHYGDILAAARARVIGDGGGRRN